MAGSKLAKVLRLSKIIGCRVLKTYKETLSVERNRGPTKKNGTHELNKSAVQQGVELH